MTRLHFLYIKCAEAVRKCAATVSKAAAAILKHRVAVPKCAVAAILKHRVAVPKCAAAAILLLFSASAPLSAQTPSPIDSVFAAVPDSILPHLTKNARLDMLDLYNYKMAARAENIFGLYSVLEEKTDSNLRIKLSDASEWELALLPVPADSLFPTSSDAQIPAADSVVYAVTMTLTAPIGESRLTLYTPTWQRLDSIPLPAPTLPDFLQSPAPTDETSEAAQILRKLTPVRYTLRWTSPTPASPTKRTLTATPSTYRLDKAARETAKTLLRPRTLAWTGRGFVLEQ